MEFQWFRCTKKSEIHDLFFFSFDFRFAKKSHGFQHCCPKIFAAPVHLAPRVLQPCLNSFTSCRAWTYVNLRSRAFSATRNTSRREPRLANAPVEDWTGKSRAFRWRMEAARRKRLSLVLRRRRSLSLPWKSPALLPRQHPHRRYRAIQSTTTTTWCLLPR